MIFQAIASSSAGNLYLLRDGESTLAIECGLRFKEMQSAIWDQGFLGGTRRRLSDLDGVLVSHEHGDHSRAIRDVASNGVDVYGLIHTLDACAVFLNHNAHILKPLEVANINGWRVLPFEGVHDVPCLGFLIQRNNDKLLYITDSAYVPCRFQGLTIIAIEANYSSAILRESGENAQRKLRSLRHHMSIETVLGFLAVNDLSKIREIHLLHLSEAHSDAALFKRLVEEATGKPVLVAGRGGK